MAEAPHILRRCWNCGRELYFYAPTCFVPKWTLAPRAKYVCEDCYQRITGNPSVYPRPDDRPVPAFLATSGQIADTQAAFAEIVAQEDADGR